MYKKTFKQSYSRSNRNSSSNWGRSSRSFGRGRGQDPDISHFIQKAKDTPAIKEYVVERSFNDLGIHPSIKANLLEKGFTKPTPIQDQAIEQIISNKDLLGIANTGTGKTAAFLIPLIHKILENRNHKALILSPTRELALQTQKELFTLSRGMQIKSTLCIGGTSLRQQSQQLRGECHIVIGTPGRLKDLTMRQILNLSNHQTLILDEVDQMLDMGFIHDIKKLIALMPKDRQTLMFSATVSDTINKLINQFTRNLTTVSVKTASSSTNVEQKIVEVRTNDEKLDTLHDLLNADGFTKVLVFGRTKRGVNKLSEQLNDRGFKSDSIHGNKSQPQRQRALQKFRDNYISVLVATDVAARGLDIQDVSHVINFDTPATYDDYIHRIGRTGRADKKGIALTFKVAY